MDPDPDANDRVSDDRNAAPRFPVVGIGSSAGGLEAVSTLLGELPAEPGFAIVVVTHGDPDQDSQLVGLLERATDMDVLQIEEGMELEPDRVYVTPPGYIPEFDGEVRPLSVDREDVSHAIDRSFRSLSETYRSRAVGVVLSGALADGVQGLQAIQQRGGIAIVQDPVTARYPSMPERAIEAGHVDDVLAPAAIADELLRVRDRWETAGEEATIADGELDRIFERVREVTGVDFSQYKRSTLVRRIHRRMIAIGAEALDDYLDKLEADADEVWALHDESLIHVTSFFRDPEVFEAIRETVLPQLLEGQEAETEAIRIWVPGCATGEEVYSLAIVATEFLEERDLDKPIQLFGTDVSERAIETAREARYPRSIEDQVSEDRLQRFFTLEDGAYRIREPLRNACVFARQDLLNDPPLSGIDLVSCRNVLIYLHHDHQERVANTLHYSLGNDGALVLGASESVQRFQELFEPLDAGHNIYSPKEKLDPRHRVAQGTFSQQVRGTLDPTERRVEATTQDREREIDRVALDLYAPPAIVLDDDLEVVEFRGDVSDYVDPREGPASLDLMRIAPQGLAVSIRAAVDEVREDGTPVREREVRFDRGGRRSQVTLRVVPVHPASHSSRYYLVAFEEPGRSEEGGPHRLLERAGGLLNDVLTSAEETEPERVRELEEELEATRAYLQSVIEDYEATNEELRSAHEEALSTNEELQSTNEELETAKEELQSTNEELTTVNEELRQRNEEIEQVNNDLVNLLEGVGLPIVMLGQDLRIRRFTPQAADLLGLIDADVGRPLDDLSLPFDHADLEEEILDVIDDLSIHRSVLRDDEGDRYRLRITPYRTQDDKIDGAVLVFWDIENPEDTV